MLKMARQMFLDTSYAIALSAPHDVHHDRAIVLASKVQREKLMIVTTRAVMIEIGNSLSRQRNRAIAISLLNAIEMDSQIKIEPLSETLFTNGKELFAKRQDKDWSLVDCISFVVMQEQGITEALTADEHFRQAGFTAMLVETE
jgi:uncharacterized protein